MAKKKEKEAKEEDVVNDTNFDWRKAFNELVKPNTFKGGLGYYIENRGLEDKIKSQKDFDKVVEDYAKTPL